MASRGSPDFSTGLLQLSFRQKNPSISFNLILIYLKPSLFIVTTLIQKKSLCHHSNLILLRRFTKHSAKRHTCIISFKLHNNPKGWEYYYLYFTDKETETERD